MVRKTLNALFVLGLFLALFGISAGMYYTNSQVFKALAAGLMLGLITFLLEILWADNFSQLTSADAGLLLCLPVFIGCSPIGLAAFVYGPDIEPDGGYWIIEQQAVEQSRYRIAIPWLDRIEYVNATPRMNVRVVATTKDGRKVSASLQASMRLNNDLTVLNRLAQISQNIDQLIRNELEVELTRTFREAVAGKNLNELDKPLVLEWEAGSNVNELLLTKLGVHWSGTLEIRDIHAYFAKDA